ncbi:hypothetical protein GOODEAATRI_031020 [Goodea atripinnis]|uniref:Uncharacterized protein n=1 Tax=Goodea atripinnis TaxID=208336 RepID=A0ABV0MM69_9TELE
MLGFNVLGQHIWCITVIKKVKGLTNLAFMEALSGLIALWCRAGSPAHLWGKKFGYSQRLNRHSSGSNTEVQLSLPTTLDRHSSQSEIWQNFDSGPAVSPCEAECHCCSY